MTNELLTRRTTLAGLGAAGGALAAGLGAGASLASPSVKSAEPVTLTWVLIHDTDPRHPAPKPGDAVILSHESEPYFEHGIAVHSEHGQRLGFVARDAEGVMEAMAQGERFEARVASSTSSLSDYGFGWSVNVIEVSGAAATPGGLAAA